MTTKRKTMTLFTLLALSALVLTLGCSATRAGYETAAYQPVEKDGAFSIREYEEMVLVSTSTEDDRRGNSSFMKLFNYISGGNDDESKVAMTTPVFMHEDSRMSFVLPAKNRENPPEPGAADVSLESVPAYRAAVLRFRGRAKSDDVERQTKRLREWMDAHNLEASGAPVLAQYDPPWTPGPLRKNEMLIPIAPQQ